MDSGFDISDPTDWNNTPLSALATLDSALRCQVCKDFFTTPMITSCSHTFCSLCIRRSLTADGKCPACRANEQEIRLRRNWAMQEVVDSFKDARTVALEVAKRPSIDASLSASEGKRGSKRKRNDDSEGLQDGSSDIRGPRTRGQLRREAGSNPLPEPPAVIDNNIADDDADFEPEDGLVACPICNKRMKPEYVFSHLDRCEEERNMEISGSKVSAPPKQSKPQNTAPPERLPQLNYSLLKDAALRKKLQELGIPSSGSRALLARRHTEWTTLWNANCDSNRPRSKRELLSELDTWERSQGGSSANGGQAVQSMVMSKDFDGRDWSKRNKGEFDQLIASARAKNKNMVAGEEVRSSRSPDMLAGVPSKTEASRGLSNGASSSPPLPIQEDPRDQSIDLSLASNEPDVKKILRASRRKDEHLRLLLDGTGSEEDGRRTEAEDGHEAPATHIMSLAVGSKHMTDEEAEQSSIQDTSEHWRQPDNAVRKMPMFDMPAEPVEDAEIVS